MPALVPIQYRMSEQMVSMPSSCSSHSIEHLHKDYHAYCTHNATTPQELAFPVVSNVECNNSTYFSGQSTVCSVYNAVYNPPDYAHL